MKVKFFFIIGMCILIFTSSNAQTWVTNTVGGTPGMYLTSTTYNLGLGMATTTSTSPYKLYAVGSSRFTNGTGYVDLIPGGPSSIEIGSSSVVYSQIDFKGSSNLGADYRGRIQYSDGNGFYMYTAGSATAKVILTDAGALGVGISPAASMQLHVEGTASKFSSGTGYIGLIHAQGTIDLGGATASPRIDFKGSANLGADYQGRILYTDGTGFDFYTAANATSRLSITEGGAVGIGSSPASGYSLTVGGPGGHSKFEYGSYDFVLLSHVGGEISLASSGGGYYPGIYFTDEYDVSNIPDGFISYTDANGISISTGGSSNIRMRVKPDGKIVIGDPAVYSTSPSGYKLYVADGILTEKVKVALHTGADWSDYVFAPDYQLLSLDSVETYINDYCHLPGVPSADQVVIDGIDVAKMDALLLQKIEELTLYMIQLDKENKELKTEIENLKKK